MTLLFKKLLPFLIIFFIGFGCSRFQPSAEVKKREEFVKKLNERFYVGKPVNTCLINFKTAGTDEKILIGEVCHYGQKTYKLKDVVYPWLLKEQGFERVEFSDAGGNIESLDLQ